MAVVSNRPLSPHLSVYKMQFTMVMSGLHRITGLGLLVGTLLFAWWILALAAGPAYFDTVQAVVGSWIGILFLMGWTFSFFYHLCNGVRHLMWDIGVGIDIPGIKTGGWIMAGTAAALTLIAWIIGFSAWS